MAIHSSVLAWRIPRTEEPGVTTGSQRVEHDQTTYHTAQKHATILSLKLKTIFMETECHNEQKVPDSFFMKFKRTHGASQFAKSGIQTGYRYLSIQKRGNQEYKA